MDIVFNSLDRLCSYLGRSRLILLIFFTNFWIHETPDSWRSLVGGFPRLGISRGYGLPLWTRVCVDRNLPSLPKDFTVFESFVTSLEPIVSRHRRSVSRPSRLVSTMTGRSVLRRDVRFSSRMCLLVVTELGPLIKLIETETRFNQVEDFVCPRLFRVYVISTLVP